jgi:hypothetical protein
MSSRVFWGFVLVLVGVLFLLSNFGVLPWDVWNGLWRTWPALLIVWGASVLLRPLGRRGAILTGIVALVAVAGVAGLVYATYRPGADVAGETVLSQPLENGIQTATLQMNFGAGSISLDGTAPVGQLATGTLGYVVRAPGVVYTSSGDAANLSLSLATGAWVGSAGPRATRWDVHLSPAPVYVLDFDTGACSTDLDLSALKVRRLSLDTGASDCRITFGDSGLLCEVRLAFGAASVTVRAPRAVGLKVRMSTGLVGTNLSQAGLIKTADTWLSPGYEAKTSQVEMRVDAGASSFNVEWID